MKLFVWERVADATTSYHNQGGLVVIAKDIRHARRQIREKCPDTCAALAEPPEHVYALSDDDPAQSLLLVFPDAGCC